MFLRTFDIFFLFHKEILRKSGKPLTIWRVDKADRMWYNEKCETNTKKKEDNYDKRKKTSYCKVC